MLEAGSEPVGGASAGQQDGPWTTGSDAGAEVAGGLVLHVRCWLLSCRSLHLGIEHAMMRCGVGGLVWFSGGCCGSEAGRLGGRRRRGRGVCSTRSQLRRPSRLPSALC